MPLSMTLNESNKIPFVMPCFDGEELHVDLELMNAGLAAISVKEHNAEDPQEEASIRHRNSFWSVHRPELSKLSWAADHTPRNIETYLKHHAENRDVRNDLLNCDIPPADFNRLTVIHAPSDRHTSTDQNYLLIPKPQTIQLNDDDLASPTTLHKSRAEFCVTIGSIDEKSIPETLEPSSSKIIEEKTMTWNENNRESNFILHATSENGETAFSQDQAIPSETCKHKNVVTGSKSNERQPGNFDKQHPDGILNTSQEMLIALMDDTEQRKPDY